jgi:hypothetical protein
MKMKKFFAPTPFKIGLTIALALYCAISLSFSSIFMDQNLGIYNPRPPTAAENIRSWLTLPGTLLSLPTIVVGDGISNLAGSGELGLACGILVEILFLYFIACCIAPPAYNLFAKDK